MKRTKKILITIGVLFNCIAIWKIAVKPLNVENVSAKMGSIQADDPWSVFVYIPGSVTVKIS